ncbi:MAG TPA: FkbM family methyltransferase [Chlamydiales bacterium]|nr:FkbM family methyltransferase [Chlamydiales bacterium]
MKFIFSALVLFSFNLFAARPDTPLQDTGIKPSPFEVFGSNQFPMNIFQAVKKYLPTFPVIVNAGAFDGKDSGLMAHFWLGGHIHSFEPVTELYQILEGRAANFPNLSTYHVALGDHCGPQLIYLSKHASDLAHVSQSSSLYPPKEHLKWAPEIAFDRTEIVDVATLDQWAEAQGVERVDFLWLDMQGYELPMMKASPKILSRVSAIFTELEFVEAYEGQPLYQEVRQWLEDQGFALIGGTFDFHDNDAWFADGLFVRRTLLK